MGSRFDSGSSARSFDRGASFSRSDAGAALRTRPSVETTRSYSPARSYDFPRSGFDSQPRVFRDAASSSVMTPRSDSAFRSDGGALRSRAVDRDVSSTRSVSAMPAGEIRWRDAASSAGASSSSRSANAMLIAEARERLSGGDRSTRRGGADSGSSSSGLSTSSDTSRSRSIGESSRARSLDDASRSRISTDSVRARSLDSGESVRSRPSSDSLKAADRPSLSDIRKRIGGGDGASTSSGDAKVGAKTVGGKTGDLRLGDSKTSGKTISGKTGDLKIGDAKIGAKAISGKTGDMKIGDAKIGDAKVGGKTLGGKTGAKIGGASTLPKVRVLPGGDAAKTGKVSDLAIGKAVSVDKLAKRDLTSLTSGSVAKKIDLSQQYQLAKQGDVARQLGLNKKGVNVTNVTNVKKTVNVKNVTIVNQVLSHHPIYRHRGWVSNAYIHGGFFHSYWGCGYFPYSCWYPRWSPWLAWSWRYHCLPIWDPRPYWCRPIVCVPAPVWVYWEVPVWQPLPVVAGGTWVNVERPVVEPDRFDLQLLAVRFVDPGHPDEKLGPRYRVWFRNNSDKDIETPFDVTILMSADGKLAANLPQAGVRVPAVKAGETQSVDVRLPFDVNKLGDVAEGQPAPKVTLQVLVDSSRAIKDVNRPNNGAKLTNADILPVDPAVFEVDPKAVVAGKELVIAGEGLGPEPGKVLVKLGGLEMEGEILGWYDLGVRLKAPNLPLAAATPADLIVVRGDGAAANPVRITVNPPALAPDAAAEPPALEPAAAGAPGDAAKPEKGPPPPPAPKLAAPGK